MIIVYIHGANASSTSFNYIRSHIKCDDYIVEYNSQNGFFKNLNEMVDKLSNMTNMFIVGHSLGGIYALHIANILQDRVIGAATLSTPYGGCEVADFVKYLVPASRLLRDIGPRSEPIISVNKLQVMHPWVNLVSTIGSSSWIPMPNDGVVSIASMRHRKDMGIIDIPTNHYEIVLLPETVNIIQTRLGLTNENI